MKRLRLLVLGGTTEAGALARRLAGEAAVDPLLSLAGATAHPAQAPIPQRIGGFAGEAAGQGARFRRAAENEQAKAFHEAAP